MGGVAPRVGCQCWTGAEKWHRPSMDGCSRRDAVRTEDQRSSAVTLKILVTRACCRACRRNMATAWHLRLLQARVITQRVRAGLLNRRNIVKPR